MNHDIEASVTVTEYPPESVAELVAVAETWVPNECAASPVGAWHIIERLADALTAVSAERDSFKHQAEHFAMRGNIAEAERDKAIATGERILADALKVSAERDRYRRLLRRTELQCQDAEYESGALRRAITEALDHDPLHGRSEGLHCGGMSPCMRGILRAALDKEGSDDE